MIFLAFFVLICILYAVYVKAFYNSNKEDMTFKVLTGEDYDGFHDEMIALIQKASKIPFEAVETVSYDKKRLVGRLYKKDPRAPLHIQFHGYRGSALRDFCGGTDLALSLNHNVLLVDQRSHGLSAGHTISFGIKERKDVLTWIKFAKEYFDENVTIYLEGISMGAATVLMASDMELTENVKGIWADCPYASPLKITTEVAGQLTGIPHICIPFLVGSAFLFGKFNLLGSSAIKSVKNAKVPIYIIHGTGDHYVPVEHSRSIYNSAPNKITLVEFDGAPHGLSYLVDPEKYKKSFYDFVKKCQK